MMYLRMMKYLMILMKPPIIKHHKIDLTSIPSSGGEVPTPKRPHTYELKREVLRTKLSQLYDYLHIEGGNIDLIDLDRFKLERNTKTGVSMLKFKNFLMEKTG